jgi:hypothetical protein
MSYHQKES